MKRYVWSFSKEVVFCVGYSLQIQSKKKKSLLKIQTFTQKAQYFHIFRVNDFVVTKGAKILYHLKNCRERLPGHRLNLIICLFKKEVPYLCLYSKKT